MRLGGVGQRFTCSVESGVWVHIAHRPGACVTATALDYASRDCRHVDPCHMTPGRVVHCRMTPPGVVRHHCRHDTSRCRTTPLSSRHLGSAVRHRRRHDTSGPSYDTTVVTTPRVRRTTLPSYDTSGPSYDTTVVRHLQVSYGGPPIPVMTHAGHTGLTRDSLTQV